MLTSLQCSKFIYQFGRSFPHKRIYNFHFHSSYRNLHLKNTIRIKNSGFLDKSPILSTFGNFVVPSQFFQTNNYLLGPPNPEPHKSSNSGLSTNSTLPPLDPDKLKSNLKDSTTLVGSTNGSKTIEVENKDKISTTSTTDDSKEVVAEVKPSLYRRFVNELKHYYHGMKLLFLDTKVAVRLAFRVMRGETLPRRERKQLVRTTADLFRLVPFAAFLIIPFMEFLLPFYIKLFPFMMPSTFKEEEKEKMKIRQKLKGKLEIAKFLQDTLADISVKSHGEDTLSLEEFQKFLKKVRESGQVADTKDLVRFSRLFEDEVTLDSLDRVHLKALCQLLEINTMGPNQLLRILLRMRLRQLKVDDRMIYQEGVDQIPVWELQQLCRERGMRSLGLTEKRLRYQLSQWLDLHLEQNLPMTLLLFSRAMYLPDNLTSEEKLTQAIASMPKSASIEAALKAAESGSRRKINKAKFEAIKDAEARLKADQKREAEALKDSAPIIQAKPSEVLEAPPSVTPLTTADPIADRLHIPTTTQPIIKSEISAKDLEQLESAIDSIALEEEELDDLKDDVAEMEKIREKAALIRTDRATSKSQKNAAKLAKRLDKMIADMDSSITDLHDEKTELLKEIEVKEVHIKHKSDNADELKDQIAVKKERVVDINDLMLSLRRIQKVDDDTKWQQILDVLDEDHDGKIELNHVLQVIKILGSENVKLNSEAMTKVLEVIDKEADMAMKLKQLEETPNSTAAPESSDTPPNEVKTSQSKQADENAKQ